MKQRYSAKREAILQCLKSTDVHPTAYAVYERLHPAFPDLSLGTVYRNLRTLEADGMIRSVGCYDGQEHFDGNAAPHSHFVCRICGRIADLKMPEVPLPPGVGGTVESCSVVYHGVCSACLAAQAPNV